MKKPTNAGAYVKLAGSDKAAPAALPLNTLNPSDTATITIRVRRKKSIDKALEKGVLMSREEYAAQHGASDEDIALVQPDGFADLPAPVEYPSKSDLAYLIYTSGSTGKPKGVMGLHCGAVNRIEWMQREFLPRVGRTPQLFAVVAGCDVPPPDSEWEHMHNPIKLNGIAIDYWVDYVAECGLSLSRETIGVLCSTLNGVPGLIIAKIKEMQVQMEMGKSA